MPPPPLLHLEPSSTTTTPLTTLPSPLLLLPEPSRYSSTPSTTLPSPLLLLSEPSRYSSTTTPHVTRGTLHLLHHSLRLPQSLSIRTASCSSTTLYFLIENHAGVYFTSLENLVCSNDLTEIPCEALPPARIVGNVWAGFPGESSPCTCLAVYSSWVASGDLFGNLIVWDESGKSVFASVGVHGKAGCTSVSFVSDSTKLCTTGGKNNDEMGLWEFNHGKIKNIAFHTLVSPSNLLKTQPLVTLNGGKLAAGVSQTCTTQVVIWDTKRNTTCNVQVSLGKNDPVKAVTVWRECVLLTCTFKGYVVAIDFSLEKPHVINTFNLKKPFWGISPVDPDVLLLAADENAGDEDAVYVPYYMSQGGKGKALAEKEAKYDDDDEEKLLPTKQQLVEKLKQTKAVMQYAANKTLNVKFKEKNLYGKDDHALISLKMEMTAPCQILQPKSKMIFEKDRVPLYLLGGTKSRRSLRGGIKSDCVTATTTLPPFLSGFDETRLQQKSFLLLAQNNVENGITSLVYDL